MIYKVLDTTPDRALAGTIALGWECLRQGLRFCACTTCGKRSIRYVFSKHSAHDKSYGYP